MRPAQHPVLLLAAAALAATLPRLHSVVAVRSKTFLSSGVEQNCAPGFADNVPPPQFVVFTVVRDEQPYIEEFVQYHLFIGVDLIYIYGECNLKWPSGALRGLQPDRRLQNSIRV
jgi:hypothetical protein